MTKREQVIQLLNFKYENATSNIVAIGISDLGTIKLSEQEVIRILCLLAEDKLIRIINRSVNDDFYRYWEVALTGECVDYFENKEVRVVANKRDQIKTWIQYTLTIIAIVISVIALFVK